MPASPARLQTVYRCRGSGCRQAHPAGLTHRFLGPLCFPETSAGSRLQGRFLVVGLPGLGSLHPRCIASGRERSTARLRMSEKGKSVSASGAGLTLDLGNAEPRF